MPRGKTSLSTKISDTIVGILLARIKLDDAILLCALKAEEKNDKRARILMSLRKENKR